MNRATVCRYRAAELSVTGVFGRRRLVAAFIFQAILTYVRLRIKDAVAANSATPTELGPFRRAAEHLPMSTGFAVDVYGFGSSMLELAANVVRQSITLAERVAMARPKTPHPTVGELEVLQILWEQGPSTVREVLQTLPQERAYTSVMSLLNVMFEKDLVTREPAGRAFRYAAAHEPEHHEGGIVREMLDRVFSGSATALVSRLLEQAEPSEEELEAIRREISRHKRKRRSGE